MSKIPKEIKTLYPTEVLNSIYLKLRWRLTKFKEIEEVIPTEGRILDLGCGFGILSNYLYLKSNKRKIIGLDYSKKRITNAKKTIRNKNLQFKVSNLITDKIPKANCYVLIDFLHHIIRQHHNEILKKIFNSLETGGTLIFQEIDKKNTVKYYFTYLLDRTLNYGEKVYYLPAKEWEKILIATGFKIKEIKRLDKNSLFPNILFICTK